MILTEDNYHLLRAGDKLELLNTNFWWVNNPDEEIIVSFVGMSKDFFQFQIEVGEISCASLFSWGTGHLEYNGAYIWNRLDTSFEMSWFDIWEGKHDQRYASD